MLCTESFRVCAITVAVILQRHVVIRMAVFGTVFRFSVTFSTHDQNFHRL